MSLVDVVPVPRRLATLLNHARPTPVDAGDSWYRFAGTADADEAELYLYDEVGWFGTSDAAFAEALAAVTAPKLTVRLNSPGGSVFQGISISNLLRSHPARVTVSVDGLAASIASVIMLAGDDVVMQPQSQAMIHKASGLCLGDDDDMEEMRNLLRRQSENIARAYASRAGGRWDTWMNRMAAETWYSADEAVAAGLADRVAQYPRKGKPAEDEPEPDAEDAAATAGTRVWDLSVFRYAGRENAPAPTTSGRATDDDAARKAAPVPRPVSAGEQGTPATGGMPLVTAAVADAPSEPIDTDAVDAAFDAAFDQWMTAAGIDPVRLRAAMAEPADTAVGPHETATEEGAWDAGAQEKRLPAPMPVATARKVYAWYDGGLVEDGKIAKQYCKLPHHFVAEDGTPGAASVSGIRAALGRLDQTDGPTPAEKDTIRRHLNGHLPSGDSEDRADTGPAPGAAAVAIPQGVEPAADSAVNPPDPPPRVLAFGQPRTHTPRTLAFGKGGSP